MDRDSIANVIGALAIHVDARDWGQLQALFARTVHVDYTSLFGGEPQAQSRKALIEGWKALLPGFSYTRHIIGTPVITLTNSGARVAASVIAWHICADLPPDQRLWLVSGRYEMDVIIEDGRPVISGLRLAAAWAEGNSGLPRIAAERASGA